MKDALLLGALLLSFATAVTAHIALAFGLVNRPPRWRGPLAFFVAPLAPYWGWREGMIGRTLAWVAGVVLYAGLRVAVRS